MVPLSITNFRQSQSFDQVTSLQSWPYSKVLVAFGLPPYNSNNVSFSDFQADWQSLHKHGKLDQVSILILTYLCKLTLPQCESISRCLAQIWLLSVIWYIKHFLLETYVSGTFSCVRSSRKKLFASPSSIPSFPDFLNRSPCTSISWLWQRYRKCSFA